MTVHPDEKIAAATEVLDSSAPDSGGGSTRWKSMRLGVCGLGVGVVALGLAMIPALAMERPLPNPFFGPEKDEPRPEPHIEPPPQREGGVTLKYKHLSVNVGGKNPKKDDKGEDKAVAPEIKITKDPARWFTISAVACALIGLVIAGVAQVRERHMALTMSAMGCCTAAITWQYIAIGIFVGAAAAVFLIVIAALGSAAG